MYVYTNHQVAVTAGAYRGYEQTVDLTGVSTIVFDANYRNGTHIRLRALVDGGVVWTASTAGEYLNQMIDVSAYTGSHTVGFDSLVVTSGTFDSEWAEYDNIRTF